jgi:hypothetical protein
MEYFQVVLPLQKHLLHFLLHQNHQISASGIGLLMIQHHRHLQTKVLNQIAISFRHLLM